MLTKYLQTALHRALYEILSDTGEFYGKIPGLSGVYETGKALEKCREELTEVLEEWVLFRISRHLQLPVLDSIALIIKDVA